MLCFIKKYKSLTLTFYNMPIRPLKMTQTIRAYFKEENILSLDEIYKKYEKEHVLTSYQKEKSYQHLRFKNHIRSSIAYLLKTGEITRLKKCIYQKK